MRTVERRTHTDIMATAKSVILMIKLFPKRAGLDAGSRWSQTALFLTQGWHMTDRVLVFAHAFNEDEAASQPHRELTTHLLDARTARLVEVCREHGDAGGLADL